MTDHVQKFELNEETLLDSAESRFQAGDYFGALTVLNNYSRRFPPCADAEALYADVYEGMELWQLAADAWFRFLDVCNEADFAEGYEGLAVAFMNQGNELQSALYYQRAVSEGKEIEPEELAAFGDLVERNQKPRLRLVSDDAPAPETLSEGLSCMKAGELKKAREVFLSVGEESSDHPAAAGLAAMCALMLGDEAAAKEESEALLEAYPEDVQALTTACAVYGASEEHDRAKEVAKRLVGLKTDRTEDLYRIATALCETGLDEEAFEKLSVLTERLPYDENVLWFYAVAAQRTGRTEQAVAALETMTTVYPRKAVARYFLERLRGRGEDEPLAMNYYYRVPEDEYTTIADFLLAATTVDDETAKRLAALPELGEFFRIAFDEMEGRDEKLQALAVRVAVRTRSDAFLREVLLDGSLEEYVKISILHELTMRNAEDSFGVVVCNLYREFFTHKIDIGPKKRAAFLKAFADVYAKFALLGDENEGKICAAAEDLYATLEEADALSYCDDRAEIAAAIYRESRLRGGEHSLDKIVELFDANRFTTQEILTFMM